MAGVFHLFGAQEAPFFVYELRSTYTGYITNIGSFERQYPYRETDFYNFDKFLFTTWRDKPNGKGKDIIPWGVEI